MDELAYKRNLNATLERLTLLWERRAMDRILAGFEVPSRALADFAERYREGYCDYPDPRERVAFWDAHLRERAALEDDSVPSAYLSEFDQGLYGGLVGGQVQFMAHPDNGWISSMVPPLLQDWSEFDRLRFDASHPWFQRYLRQLDLFREGAAGKFGISHFILINHLNFVFELVGATNTYRSLLDCPEMVRRAISFAFELNLTVQEAFFQRVPLLRGGTYSNMVQWMPGRIVSESVDPFHMTSVAYFERWGREPVERMLGRFDGGVLHLHGNGRHLLEAVCSLRGLKAIYMGDDRGFPAAVDMVHEFRRRAGEMPLIVSVPFERFQEKLAKHELAGGVFYRVSGTPNVDLANQCMDRVRAYRV